MFLVLILLQGKNFLPCIRNKKSIMSRTDDEFAAETHVCSALFEKKARDYGTSWRILRLPSLTDQIFIKASRIRSLQETGENRVGDAVEPEFVAMVNYAVMALMQSQLLKDGDGRMELPVADAMRLYDRHLAATVALMDRKNHDYGEA